MSDKELMPWDLDAARTPAAGAGPGALGPAPEQVAGDGLPTPQSETATPATETATPATEDAASEPAAAAPEPSATAQAAAAPVQWTLVGVSVLGAVGTLVLAAVLLSPGATLGASAASWLPGLADPNQPEAALWPRLLIKLVACLPADVRADPLWALMWLQTSVAWLALWGVWALARRVAGWPAALCAVALALAWPSAREGLATASVEAVLATAGLWCAWAAVALPDAPLRGSVVLALAVAAMAAVHPLGLVAAPLALLAALILPVAHSPDALETAHGRPDLPAGQRWLGWMAAAVLATGLVLLATRGTTLKVWGAIQLAILRTPADRPALGGLCDLPIVGFWLALAVQMPLGVLALAWTMARRGIDAEVQEPAAAVVGTLLALLAALAVVGAPFPAHLDPLLVVAPLLCVLAGCAMAYKLFALAADQRKVALAVFAVAVLVLVAGEGRLLQQERRGLLARLPWVVSQTEPHAAVALRPADVALLQRFAQPTAVLPARPGGAAIATALKGVAPSRTGAVFVHPHRAQLVMLPEPPRHPTDRAFGDYSAKVACTSDLRYCLHRLGAAAAP